MAAVGEEHPDADLTPAPTPLEETPFPGGELTIARAAKLLQCPTAEVDRLIDQGELTVRPAPRPGGGQQVLVSLESIQLVKAARAPAKSSAVTTSASPRRRSPKPEEALLVRRPGAPRKASRQAKGVSETGAADAQVLESLVTLHVELLEKLDELIRVLREKG